MYYLWKAFSHAAINMQKLFICKSAPLATARYVAEKNGATLSE